MIAGPASVYICDSCVRVCKTIIDRELGEKSAPPKGSDEKPVFNLQRPSVIKGFLDQHVIGQEHAKKVLAMSFHDTENDITLEPVYCLGNCACSPAIMINGKTYGRVDEARFNSLLDSLRGAE